MSTTRLTRGGAVLLLLCGSHCLVADRRHRYGHVTLEEARRTTTANQGGSGASLERAEWYGEVGCGIHGAGGEVDAGNTLK
jgi:hypothetical protein